MVYKRARGWTSGRSLPVLNFVKHPLPSNRNVAAVHAQVCRLFCVVYIPLLSLVQLGYPAITNIFVVNKIIRYNGAFAITNIFFCIVTLRYSGVPLYRISGFSTIHENAIWPFQTLLILTDVNDLLKTNFVGTCFQWAPYIKLTLQWVPKVSA